MYRGGIGGEEDDNVRDLVGPADAAERVRSGDLPQELTGFLGAHAGQVAMEHRCVDRPGRDRIDPNPVTADLGSQCPRGRDQASLGRRVRHASRQGHVRLNRRDEHDAPSTTALQLRDRELSREERAFKVGIEDQVDRLLALVLELLVDRDGSVGHHDVEPAEALSCHRDRLRDIAPHADVPDRRSRYAARRRDLGDCLVQTCRGEIVDDDRRTRGGESDRRRAADPGAGPGDEGNLVFKHTHRGT